MKQTLNNWTYNQRTKSFMKTQHYWFPTFLADPRCYCTLVTWRNVYILGVSQPAFLHLLISLLYDILLELHNPYEHMVSKTCKSGVRASSLISWNHVMYISWNVIIETFKNADSWLHICWLLLTQYVNDPSQIRLGLSDKSKRETYESDLEIIF